MADKLLLEDGSGGYQLEDGSGVLLLDVVSPDITVGLTGQKSTSASGTLGRELSFALTGRSATSAQGAVKAGESFTLAGRVITPAAGAVAPGIGKTLTGRAITSTEGALGVKSELALTGGTITAAPGTIVANLGGDLTLTLAGLAVTTAAGTITPSIELSPDVTVGLSGLQAVLAAGQIGLSGDNIPVLPPRDYVEAGVRRPRPIYLIKVDGREFLTQSVAEAVAVLNQVKDLARQHALEISQDAAQRVLDGRAKAIRPAVPKITSSRTLAPVVREVRREIADIYAAAFRDAEISMLFELSRRADEEEDISILLM